MKVYRKSKIHASQHGRRSARVTAARNSKTINTYVLQGNYGYGWDDLVSYDHNVQGYDEAKQDKKAYMENQPANYRIIERRVDNPDYVKPVESSRRVMCTKNYDAYTTTDIKEIVDKRISECEYGYITVNEAIHVIISDLEQLENDMKIANNNDLLNNWDHLQEVNDAIGAML